MKATELLEQQHREVETLFKQFESAKTDAQKTRLFEQIAAALVAHDAIEREIFYPACEKDIDDEDVLKESLVEHGLVEFCIFRADKNRGGASLESYVKVLKEVVEHHVKEEEDELLPKAERELGAEKLEQLGQKMEARFAKAVASDFRKPLRANLQQVLAGRMKTKPSKVRAARPKTTRTARAKTTRAKTQRRRASASR